MGLVKNHQPASISMEKNISGFALFFRGSKRTRTKRDESSDESFPRFRGIKLFQVASIGTMPWWSYTPWVSGTWVAGDFSRFSGGEGELPHGNKPMLWVCGDQI